MKAGDKVSLWYNSGNRDEAKFVNPWLFDVTRDPNPHVGYGGGGAHFCLGANLARREIRVLFEELHRQIPDIVAVEEPAILLLGVHPRHQAVTGRLDGVIGAPTRSGHRLGPVHVALEAERGRHLAIAVAKVGVSGVVAGGPRQQRARRSSQMSRMTEPSADADANLATTFSASARSVSVPRSSNVSTNAPTAGM